MVMMGVGAYAMNYVGQYTIKAQEVCPAVSRPDIMRHALLLIFAHRGLRINADMSSRMCVILRCVTVCGCGLGRNTT